MSDEDDGMWSRAGRWAFGPAFFLLPLTLSGVLPAACGYPAPEQHLDLARFEGVSLVAPRDYDAWPLAGASLGLSYSPEPLGATPAQTFHRVYINPTSYRVFQRTGVFPEGTTFVLELYDPVDQMALPARAGKYEGRRVAVEASVKDTRRFGGWGYFSLDKGRARTARAFESSRCQTCHVAHGATDSVFTQFYPRLREAAEAMTPATTIQPPHRPTDESSRSEVPPVSPTQRAALRSLPGSV